MYLPAHFQEDDPAALLAFMRAHPFAVVVTAPSGVPFASHVPLLIDEDESGTVTLRSHLARANKQWTHFEAGEVLVIFGGPHALVHPAWYESQPNVPTWNYVVVHAYGTATLVHDAERVRDIAYGLVREHTPDMAAVPADFERRLLAGVVTFELRVTRLQGKFKLSQNKTALDREQVARQLEGSGRDEERAVAALMRERE
ncbi:FMN-binding negative transcriptional regulator [Deinococcus yavapaiensis]|uniref:PaiB family negative transcriptional regulator n=1 Tax=Deinococcus yavapaiensis KR-236 TaxID=694435 RepID=A0A318S5Y2_9DEIO|nr:FMN-binding negative transcriptional regulator [Deinococcus yavapaiensis]PYE53032.1 PaiB family negative transcriptional regulator [Deinococcus yavapaiensis KR-236]